MQADATLEPTADPSLAHERAQKHAIMYRSLVMTAILPTRDDGDVWAGGKPFGESQGKPALRKAHSQNGCATRAEVRIRAQRAGGSAASASLC
jgi:hypothetical protein